MNRFVALSRALPAALLALAVVAQPAGGEMPKEPGSAPTTMDVRGRAIHWQPQVDYERLLLTVVGPHGRTVREFERGQKAAFEAAKEGLADGEYDWEVRLLPAVPDEVRKRLTAMRDAADRLEVDPGRSEGLPSGQFVQSGTFLVQGGEIVSPGKIEPEPQPREPEPMRLPGDLEIAGDLTVAGAKHFSVPDPESRGGRIVYASLEGPEVGTYFRGTARLADGSAVIELPSHFAKTTEAEGLTVQLTPLDAWSDLYVAEKGTGRLVVRSADGEGSARFDFLIQGVRKGFAGFVAESTDEEGDRDDVQ